MKKPSIRAIAKLAGKDYTTVQRWQTTNPWLFAAVMEKAKREAEQQGG